MLLQKLLPHRIILIALAIIIMVLGAMIFAYPMAIFPDPSWGFQVMQKMQMGGGFNMASKPNALDINTNYTEFLSWWSPGQYLVPSFFKLFFGVNTGRATAITVTLFSLLGITGFYFFFKKAGFSKMLAAISVVIIASQQAFIVPYIFYNGGEILLFGFVGWFFYGCVSINKTGVNLLVFLLFSGWIGFFCKSSFLWAYAAACIYLWINLSQKATGVWVWIKNGFWIGIPAFISLATIYIYYLSKGTNPASESSGFLLTWATFCFPLASPLLAGFSLDDLLHGLVVHNSSTVLNPSWSLITLIFSAILSVVMVISIIRVVPNKKYTLLLTVFYVFSILFFGYSFLRQADISYESRHLRLIGLMVTPGVVYWVSQWKQPFKIIFSLFCLMIAFFTVRYFIPSYRQNKVVNARGTSGLAQAFIDQPSLNYIINLDRQHTDALFVLLSPDLGLEINHNRYIILDPIDAEININFDSYVHRGHAGPIFILLPSSYMGPKSNIIRKCFPNYTGFRMEMLSDKYVLYSAK